MKRLVCFDFDGVIIHSENVQHHAFTESYQKTTGMAASEELIQEFFRHSGDSLTNILKKMGLPLGMGSIYREESMARNHEIELHDGMKELLIDLKNQNILCSLCTGKDRERTIQILKNLSIYEYFDAIICADDILNPKPNPESLNLLLKKLPVKKEDTVMIGDANNDVKCAKAAGVTSIGVTWGIIPEEILRQEHPDYLAHNMSELKEIMASLVAYEPKKQYLFNDFVVAEDVCNMKCEYCLTQTSKFEKEKDRKSSRKKLSCLTYKEGTDFKERMDAIQNNLLKELDVAVLKISGGEIMMLPNIEEYILSQAKNYRGIQILTNGVLLKKEQLLRLKETGNISLQISLDHHLLEGNRYRTKDEKILNQIRMNLDLAYEIGIPVEINCVLTDRNTGILSGFLNYLSERYEKDVVIYPFPVRGADRKQYYIKKEQINEIEKIIDDYERYANILAPKPYMEHLLDFLKTDERKTRCYLPYIAIGTFEDGTVTACPNYWFNSFGSIIDDPKNAVKKIGTDFIYQILCGDKKRFHACTSCFTPWETFNLYMEDAMTLEELTKAPSYNFDGVNEYIRNIKRRICENV